MNQAVESHGARTATGVRWLLVVVAVLVLFVINCVNFMEVRALQQTRDGLRRIEEAESSKVEELTQFAARAREATEEFTRNRTTLLSMYSQCLTTEEFFVVHPEMVASARVLEENGFACLLSLPPGKFTLEVELASVGVTHAATGPPDAPLVRPTVWEYALEGGRVYRIAIRLDAEGKEKATLTGVVTGQPTRTFDLPACQIMAAREAVIGGVLRAPHRLVGRRVRGDSKLLDAGFFVASRGDQQESEISIRATLQCQGPRRLAATDERLLEELLGSSLTGVDGVTASLPYEGGWYELPDAERRP